MELLRTFEKGKKRLTHFRSSKMRNHNKINSSDTNSKNIGQVIIQNQCSSVQFHLCIFKYFIILY